MYSSTLPSTSALDVGGWSTLRPGRINPRKDPVFIVKKAGWAPGPVWRGAEYLDPPGFDSRTVQPVASHYTDWAIPTPHICHYLVEWYEGESIINRTVCFIFRKTRAVDQTGESEGVRSRLYRVCSNNSKFSFLRFSTMWAVSASVMDVDWRPVPSPCLTFVRPFLNLSLH
jgi:hypothetical protein